MSKNENLKKVSKKKQQKSLVTQMMQNIKKYKLFP
jgi:hypothetical protein